MRKRTHGDCDELVAELLRGTGRRVVARLYAESAIHSDEDRKDIIL